MEPEKIKQLREQDLNFYMTISEMFDAVKYLNEQSKEKKNPRTYDLNYAIKQAKKYHQTNKPQGSFATNFISVPEKLNLVAENPKTVKYLWAYFEKKDNSNYY